MDFYQAFYPIFQLKHVLLGFATLFKMVRSMVLCSNNEEIDPRIISISFCNSLSTGVLNYFLLFIYFLLIYISLKRWVNVLLSLRSRRIQEKWWEGLQIGRTMFLCTCLSRLALYINQSINFNLNSHKHFYSIEKKNWIHLNIYNLHIVMRYLLLSLRSEVLRKEKELTVLIEGWLWRVWNT